MLDLSRWFLFARAGFSTGAELHRAALEAAHAGRYHEALLAFSLARDRYKREYEVEGVARVRVHQLMVRVRAGLEPTRHAEMMLDVERWLSRLDRIESLEPPFEPVDARTLLASWKQPRALRSEPASGDQDLARAA